MVTRRLLTAAAVPALLLISIPFAGTAGAADIYRWVDADGNVHFGDTPPDDRSVEQVEVRPPIGDSPPVDAAEPAAEQPGAPDEAIEAGEEAASD